MENISIHTDYKKLLSDTTTPVNIYLKLRDVYPACHLLESSDYHGSENSFSYICCNPFAEFCLQNDTVHIFIDRLKKQSYKLKNKQEALLLLQKFYKTFQTNFNEFEFISNGLFGYMSYDSVRYFEDITFDKHQNSIIPEIRYQAFKIIIAINHFKNELYVFNHRLNSDKVNLIPEIESLIRNKNISSHKFYPQGDEYSALSDKEFIEMVEKGKYHCHRGDVFQLVLSRKYNLSFKGDEFNIYRALRSVNPSPYLFYFDYGNYRLFGSSPEAQLVVKKGKAQIYPIAGTFRRTGNYTLDHNLAEKLKIDPKENSEHIMLVDLARNDLSRNGTNVTVEVFKEIQFYSHVIHLVSKVSADVSSENLLKIAADTFPAGTLSGAPKHMAMQLINKYEHDPREYYGGCIGVIGFNNLFNHAIMIRSFLSRNNQLFYQAGAGIVEQSESIKELKEVDNKLEALRNAIKLAAEL